MRAFCLIALVAATALVAPATDAQQYQQRVINGRAVWVPIAPAIPAKPPVVTPTEKPGETVEVEAAATSLPTGVRIEMLSPIEKCTAAGGAEIDQAACYSMLGAGAASLVDDSRKATVTVAAADAKLRGEIVTKVRQANGDKVKIWDGPPDDWSFRPGFQFKPDRVTLLCEAADGSVLQRKEVVDVAQLDGAIEAIRKAVPEYDPSKDPGNGGTITLPDLTKYATGENLTGLAACVGAAVLLFLVLRK